MDIIICILLVLLIITICIRGKIEFKCTIEHKHPSTKPYSELVQDEQLEENPKVNMTDIVTAINDMLEVNNGSDE